MKYTNDKLNLLGVTLERENDTSNTYLVKDTKYGVVGSYNEMVYYPVRFPKQESIKQSMLRINHPYYKVVNREKETDSDFNFSVNYKEENQQYGIDIKCDPSRNFLSVRYKKGKRMDIIAEIVCISGKQLYYKCKNENVCYPMFDFSYIEGDVIAEENYLSHVRYQSCVNNNVFEVEARKNDNTGVVYYRTHGVDVVRREINWIESYLKKDPLLYNYLQEAIDCIENGWSHIQDKKLIPQLFRKIQFSDMFEQYILPYLELEKGYQKKM